MNEIAMIFGYALITIYVFYASYDLMGKPRINTDRKIMKLMQPQNIAIITRILAMWMVVFGIGLLNIMTQDTDYASFFDTMTSAGVLLMTAYSLIYFALFVIFLLQDALEKAAPTMRWKDK